MKFRSIQRTGWTRIFPPLTWLAEYKPSWLRHDAIAGVTLAAYAIPVSLAYRDLLRAEGLADKTDSGAWLRTLDSVLEEGNVRERSGLHQERPSGP